MSPKLRALLARATLVAGVALVASFAARHAPHQQVILVRLPGDDVSHVDGVVTLRGDDEPTAGFSRDFAAEPVTATTPSRLRTTVRHTFSAPNGTYIVIITVRHRRTGDENPIPTETTFQRQVNLAGGEVTISPD